MATFPHRTTRRRRLVCGLRLGVLVPAGPTLLAHRAWSLPRTLNRVLPNVDIEGEALSRP